MTPPSSDRFLIVNADDFGRERAINEGVIAAHERGIVTSASLMVRGPSAREAAAHAREHPKLGLGLHLDLGEWIYRDGDWACDYEVVSVKDEGAVTAEVDRQLASFEDLVGRPPTHVDSHQHVHRSEPVRTVVRTAAATLGIHVRQCDGITFRGDFYGRGRYGQPLPSAITVEALITVLRSLSPGANELCCHPGTRNVRDPVYGLERARELAVLCDPRVKEMLEAEAVVLCSFSDRRDSLCAE